MLQSNLFNSGLALFTRKALDLYVAEGTIPAVKLEELAVSLFDKPMIANQPEVFEGVNRAAAHFGGMAITGQSVAFRDFMSQVACLCIVELDLSPSAVLELARDIVSAHMEPRRPS